MILDADRARKHGMDEFIAADPSKYDHSNLFQLLQNLTLTHRLGDSYSCLVTNSSMYYVYMKPEV